MVTLGMLAMGALPAAFLFIAGPWLFSLLLGERWITAGEYTAVLAPWLLAMFAAAPASTVYIVLRRQSVWLRMQTIRTILMAAGLYLPYFFGYEAIDCIAIFSIAATFSNVTVIVAAIALCSRYDRTLSG